ncbi:MAG: hypothetical protein Q9185_007076 [Variospora sp. 1 TL-2023]
MTSFILEHCADHLIRILVFVSIQHLIVSRLGTTAPAPDAPPNPLAGQVPPYPHAHSLDEPVATNILRVQEKTSNEPVKSPSMATRDRPRQRRGRATVEHGTAGISRIPTRARIIGTSATELGRQRARPTSGEASPGPWFRVRRACYWTLSLLVVIGILVYTTTHLSIPVEHQKVVDFVVQATFSLSSAYAAVHCCVSQVAQWLPTTNTNPTNSSRAELGQGLDDTYTSLSEALAASNLLYEAPTLVSQKRGQAMKFKIPEESLILEPLQRFLDQSVHMDVDLLHLLLRMGQLSTLALRQTNQTRDVVEDIQRVQYWVAIEQLHILLLGKAVQEDLLSDRLQQHIELLSKATVELYEDASKVLQKFVKLSNTAQAIREACEEDRRRLLRTKGRTAGQRDWLVRALILFLPLNEPEDLAQISRNVDLAADIHTWSQDIVTLLEHMTTKLLHTKVHLNLLMKIIQKHRKIRWTSENKHHELEQFRAQVAEGSRLLQASAIARLQLQQADTTEGRRRGRLEG